MFAKAPADTVYEHSNTLVTGDATKILYFPSQRTLIYLTHLTVLRITEFLSYLGHYGGTGFI
jgi:hypothetical protein